MMDELEYEFEYAQYVEEGIERLGNTVAEKGFRIGKHHRQFTTEHGRSYDCLSALVRKKNNCWGYVQLCESPRLEYLNLIDYQEKVGDFQSISCGPLRTVSPVSNFHATHERLWKFSWISTFAAFVHYARRISVDIEELPKLCWKIAKLLKYVSNFDIGLLQQLCTQVVYMCLDLNPQHGVLLITVLKHLSVGQDLKTFVIERLFLTGADKNFLRTILYSAVGNRFDFWTIWERNSSTSAFPFCPVTFSYLTGKFGHLEVLLEYGFRQNHNRKSSALTVFEKFTFYMSDLEYFRWLSRFLPQTDYDSRSTIVDEVVLFICMLPDEWPIQEAIVRCFQLLWNARKDPFVTKEELLEAFEMKCLEYPDTNRGRDDFMEGLKKYTSMVLENGEWQVPQPRSLQHLCKCTIREALNDQWGMPYGVVRLPLPDRMKSYILLETSKKPEMEYLGDDSIWYIQPFI